jgi:hypothetical protein
MFAVKVNIFFFVILRDNFRIKLFLSHWSLSIA